MTAPYHPFLVRSGGRRFAMTMGAAFVYTLLLWFGKLDGNQYVTLQSLTIGSYLITNTYQKVKQGTPE